MVNNVFVRLLAGHLDHELWADFSGSGGGRRPSVQAGEGLGAQAGEARLTEVIRDGGFTKVHKATQGPFNMVFEARAWAASWPGASGADDRSARHELLAGCHRLTSIPSSAGSRGRMPEPFTTTDQLKLG